MSTVTRKRRLPGQAIFARRTPTLDDLMAEKFAPPPVEEATEHTVRKTIIATRWQNAEGRWLYVAEIPVEGRRKDDAERPPMFGIFADNPNWNSLAPLREKVERMLTNWFHFPWSSGESAQAQLDCYAANRHWTPDPPLPVDDDRAKPVRAGKRSADVADLGGPLCGKCGWPCESAAPGTFRQETIDVSAKPKKTARAEPVAPAKTATRPKNLRGAKRAGKSHAAESPLFSHARQAIGPAAEKWLAAHGVPENQLPAWVLVLPEQPVVSISLDDWKLLVDQLLRPWLAAGWQVAKPEDEYLLAGTAAGLGIGVSLDMFGLGLHEPEEHDPDFRRLVSSTGFRQLSVVDWGRITRAGLDHHFEQHAAAWRDECQSKARDRKPKPGGKPAADARKPAASTALIPAGKPSGALSKTERHDLAKLEATIRNGVHAFTAVGNALTEIQARRLYRQDFATFEDYCRQVWNFGRAEAFDKIAAARIAGVVSPISDKAKVPLKEDHLKALAPLGDPKDIRAVYNAVVTRCQKEHEPVTGKLLREERRRYETPEDEPEKGRNRRDAESKLPAADAPWLSPDRQREWSRALSELAEHVHSVTENWQHCRGRLALALREWAETLEP
jgi:hypothetical protein